MADRVDLGGQILILTGPPGSGKTTVAAALAKLPGSPKVHVRSDDFWHYIQEGHIAPFLPAAHEQNRVVMQALAQTAQTFARGSYFVILDGIVGPWFLKSFENLGVPIHYIVLRPSLEVAVQRCKMRGGAELTDSGPITDLHQQFADLAELEPHVLAADGTLTQTLSAVVAALASRDQLL